jgi:hypothetical protein
MAKKTACDKLPNPKMVAACKAKAANKPADKDGK